MLKSIFCIIGLIAFAVVANAQTPIIKEDFTDFIWIQKGEDAKIRWKFDNADRVKILDDDFEFSALDSTYISPEVTTKFYITAYNETNDSLVLVCKVFVAENGESFESDDEVVVQRGPIVLKQKDLGISLDNNKFLSGSVEATQYTEPAELRIINNFFDTDDNTINLKALILDEFGNYLSGIDEYDNINQWYVEANCNNVTNKPELLYLNENVFDKDFKLDISILLDASAAQFAGKQVLMDINNLIQHLSEDCNIMFSLFNQKHNQIFPLSPKEKALWELQNFEPSDADGLNSLYKSAYLSLDLMNSGFHPNKICIIITYISDNSSIIYTAKDVYKLSNELGIPIYIIGLGEAIDSYSLKSLATSTGGRFYHLMSDETGLLEKVLTEITLSQVSNYEMSFSYESFKQCSDFYGTLNFEMNNSKVYDKFLSLKKPEFFNLKYQSLVNFDYKDDFINNDYYEVLNSLVYVMTNNPKQEIILIGHSSIEGTEEDNINYSNKRANQVKQYLVNQGIAEKRIQTKAEGFHKPIFFLQQSDWEQKYNRRVELKWLDPTVKPYELIIDIANSEEQAIKLVESWEKKGYKAYYDRYIVDNTTVQYQVKIWNFSSEDEAQKAAKEINKKYKTKAYME
jgi:hypothetical protein